MPIVTTINSSKDNYMSGTAGEQNTNYGNLLWLAIKDGSAFRHRSIIEFPLTSLPPSAVISAALMRLWYGSTVHSVPTGKTVWAYKQVRPDWVELQSTWIIYSTGNNWATPGGDYVIINPVGGSTVVPAAPLVWMEWDVLAIVQDAFLLGIPVEILVRFALENVVGLGSTVYLAARESDIDPQLVITYTAAPVVQTLPATGVT